MPEYKLKSILLIQGEVDKGIFEKMKLSKDAEVFLCEGRPSLEAGKSNAAAFLAQGITPTVICDNMAGFLFAKGLVKELFLACQLVDKSGALAGTGALICAVLAKRHKVPVTLVRGKNKARFLGDPQDILFFEGVRTAPRGTLGYVPLVEWVPGKYLKPGFCNTKSARRGECRNLLRCERLSTTHNVEPNKL